jgi:3-methyl-2-oxobutanoate hydroxymethyltransferase
MSSKVTLPSLHAMKERGEKIVGVVAWDYQVAQVVDRAGVEIVSVGDTVGANLWGDPNPLSIGMDEMVVVCRAVRRGVERALVSVDFPYGPLQEGVDSAVKAAIRLVKEAGADMIKLDGAADYPEAVTALKRAGIPVFAQFGITPQTALQYGIEYSAQSAVQVPPEMTQQLIDEAKMLEAAGADLLDFTNSGPVVGPEVVKHVNVPVIGGFGGGPWLDGRVRMVNAAVGYPASALDKEEGRYANVAKIIHDAIGEYAKDVRAGRQIRGGVPVKPA